MPDELSPETLPKPLPTRRQCRDALETLNDDAAPRSERNAAYDVLDRYINGTENRAAFSQLLEQLAPVAPMLPRIEGLLDRVERVLNPKSPTDKVRSFVNNPQNIAMILAILAALGLVKLRDGAGDQVVLPVTPTISVSPTIHPEVTP